MDTPDVTPTQVRAIILWVVSLLSLFGIAVSDATTNTVTLVAVGFLTTVLPVILVIADAAIRRARANNVESILRTRDQYQAPAEPYVG